MIAIQRIHRVCQIFFLAIILTACSNPSVLVDQSVTVAAGGGGADVTFKGTNGQKIGITLTASSASMEPYGFLVSPDGSGQYTPSLDRATNGSNTIQLVLTATGEYKLTVFDGSNQGGKVSVRVIVLP